MESLQADIPVEQMLEISAKLIEDEDIRRIVFEPIDDRYAKERCAVWVSVRPEEKQNRKKEEDQRLKIS